LNDGDTARASRAVLLTPELIDWRRSVALVPRATRKGLRVHRAWISGSAYRVAQAARDVEGKPDLRLIAELTRRRDEGLRNARSAMDAGDWSNAAAWEERAIVSADALAALYDGRPVE
jgi:hypothetical protein